MKENYRAWNIDIDTLVTPRDFVKVAILAPSSHNSQPWSFRIEDDKTILITLDSKRRLPESDTNDRQAVISVGCAIANIEILAEYHGYACTIEMGQTDTLATLRFSKRNDISQGEAKHLATVISKRVTNRSPHDDRPLDQEVLHVIRTLASDSLRIDVVEDRILIRRLGTVAIDAGIAALEDSGFRRELSTYLKSNSTRDFVGMPGFGFGFPAPLALFAPTFIRLFNMEKLAKKQNVALFEKTTAILILSTPNDTKAEWLSVGRTYEHIALLATRVGMTTAPWAATVQIGEYYSEIQKILNVAERPQFFARFGFPIAPTPHSPRLSTEQVII